MPKKKYPLFILNIIIVILLVIALAFLINIFISDSQYNEQQIKNQIQKQDLLNKEQEEKLAKEQQAYYFEEKTKAMEIEYTDTIKNKNTLSDIKDEKSIFNYDEAKPKNNKVTKLEEPQIINTLPEQIKPKPVRQLPKLVIIVDDVTNSSQVKKIQNIPFPVTMAFLPPTSRHKNSAKISKNIDTYMIHLPLEAGSRKYEEENTLHISDSLETIENKIKQLKKLYPNTKYINNHTGSKFTANYNSMDKLLKVLKKHNYTFIDSRTTSKTVSKEIATKYDLQRFARNIFLDNKQDKKYIQKQLQKAVRIARKNGYAIAICHPHNITLKTLAKSKYLLKGLDIVLIDKL